MSYHQRLEPSEIAAPQVRDILAENAVSCIQQEIFVLKRQAYLVVGAYLALLIVMGGRTALFVSHFDDLLKISIFGGNITVLSMLLAVALMLGVSGSAWWRAHYPKNARARQTATWTMLGAALLDGAFNVSEAIILANKAGTLDDYTGVVQYWLWFTVLLIGIGPTLLTMGLASLAGAVDSDARREEGNTRTRTRINVNLERTTESNRALDAHWTNIAGQLPAGSSFSRADIERVTGKAKGQAINIINYGVDRGYVIKAGRSEYTYNGSVEIGERDR